MSQPPLSPGEHRALVNALAHELPAFPIALDEAFATVLAEDLLARLPVPPFTNSAMDGFAIRHADLAELPVRLPVIADIPAGSAPARAVGPGQAARIMTGARLPEGADTVVKVEMTDHRPGIAAPPATVTIHEAPPPGANIRHRGENVEAGARILHAGTVLDGPALAAAASVGHGEVLARPRPRIGIVTTGTELVAAGGELADGQIPDSNTLLLAGLVRETGAVLAAQARTDDDPDRLIAALESWPAVDLVVTAGGISAGAYEVVRQALAGPGMRFHRVAQQPGGPQGLGTITLTGRRVPVMCLPGNPVSVFVSFHVYVAPLIAALAGRPSPAAVRTVVAGADWNSPEAKMQFIPLRLDGEVAYPVHASGSGSHLVASLPLADGLGVVPPETTRVEAGTTLEFLPTRPGSHPVLPGSPRPGPNFPRTAPNVTQHVPSLSRTAPRLTHTALAEPEATMDFTHLRSDGSAHMVDVTAKAPTVREASAVARVECSQEVMRALREGSVPKGDVLAVARIAGIQAAKRTPELLPLAHVIGVHGCQVDLSLMADHVAIAATVRTADRTGVEMEALTAVTVAALAVVDMIKGVDRSAVIAEAKVVSKSGGRSGQWTR